MQLPSELHDWLSARLKTEFRAEFRGWQHAQSRVWLVTPKTGSPVYLKAFLDRRKFSHELHFYQNWAEKLPTPELREAGQQNLLLSQVPGQPLEGQTPNNEAALHENAGRLLATLHVLPVNDTDIALNEALAKRCQACCSRARDCVEPHLIDRIRSQVTEILPDLKTESRVPCHRDYTPRNWLVDNDDLHLIDFEHSRLDLRLLDFEKLATQVWPQRPDLKEAFFRGYGTQLDKREETILNRLAALAALATVAWAVEHKDSEFEARGRALLAHLLNPM